MPHKNPEERRAYYERYRRENVDKIRQMHRERYQRDKEKIKERVKRYARENKEKCAARARAWREEHKIELKSKRQRYHNQNREFLNQKDREEYRTPKVLNRILLSSFGITLDQFNAMNDAQGGLCAICKRPPITKASRLSVDHCHETGKVRGLLCTRCNTGIGMLNDSIEYVESALIYLVSHKNVLAKV